MKILLIYIGLTAITIKASLVSNDHIMNQWRMFKAQHGKTYKDEGEEEFRMQVYLNNSHYINEHNKLHAKGEVSYSLKMNKFGDLLPREFEQMMLKNFRSRRTISSDLPCKRITLNQTSGLSKTWDWRDEGAVSPIKDQTMTSCGACWAFSAVAVLESHHYMRTKEMVILSEQNLLDCATERRNEGCRGGFAADALRYVSDHGGIDSEDSYPYIGRTEKCEYNPKYSADQIKGCLTLPATDEQQLKMAVEKVGPVTVTLYADSSLAFFHDGVYYNKYCADHPGVFPNHELLVVGFGTLEGKDYWLLKNSWGAYWGNEGFFKTARNAKNHCGIANDSNYPTVEI